MMISEPSSFTHSFSFNELQRVHPLSSLPNSTFYRATSPVQSQSSNSLDDVTTIFVVGFPEDMAEREFQNMFTFCPGFEAASLKLHCKDQEDDIPLNGGKKQMIGFARFRTRLEALEAIEVLGGKKIDQDKGTVLKAEMAKKNLHIKKPNNATTTTSTNNTVNNGVVSSSSSTTNNANINTNINNNTITNTNIAAPSNTTTTTTTNMNNMNINTNGIINTNTTTSSSSSTSTSTTNFQHNNTSLMDSLSSLNKSFNANATNALNGGRYDAFSPLPSDLLSPHDYKSDLFMNTSNGMLPPPPHPSHPSQSFNDSIFALRSQSFDHDLGFIPQPRPLMNNTNNIGPILPSRLKTVEDITSVDPYPYLSKSSPVPHENHNSRHHASFDASSFLDQDLMRMSSLSILTSPPTHSSNLRASSISVSSPHQLQQQQQQQRLHNNPADQNPPCNTLYVGNLPLNTSEEELRQLFSVCKGYRRMCFRTKPQGPMCFVEFEEIPFASQALAELQGYHLTNSIKGGIRLSYSKNPLFIKPNRESLFKPSDR